MKQLIYTCVLMCCVMCSSCNDYLDIVPKGNKIPTTLADYEALLRDEYTIGQTSISNALYLLNDYYVTVSNLNSPTLTRANYMWDETADRILLNNADESTYYQLYAAISSCNLIIENVPSATEATDAERAEVIAYAKVIRSLCYFVLANYYADTYDAATAGEKRSVPLITSANINAPSQQVTIQVIYDFIIQGVQEAIGEGLPEQSMTVLHPNLGAAYALLARVYLQMQNYSEALNYANLALEQNDQLYDWNAYYDEHRSTIENPEDYTGLPTPTDYSYVENYYFRCGNGSPNYTTNELNIPVERAERFEEGDARFLSRWKLYSQNQDTYYRGVGNGYFNWGGLTTTEVYLIKAECQARLAQGGDFTEAMNTLNAVRQTRIRPEVYQPLTASTLTEAIELIRRTKDNELIFSIVPFADARRFNQEGTYARTMTKTYEGETYTLRPDSHLWTMPFPAGAINNPGNGSIQQNVSK
ncbi:RagB/SusD family nutrient uptake outer membrane protein [Phocaeicola salanitronis]|uniref:RagB/SusD family nutrient uptake outer membrane protein n=1 Tax=Phocaeicola salanitronis TaxID=376805 RepID=UPI0023F7C3E2|nr:RagB/SusD family nutrient uptake outer membrane protein [Phocaeicola salanitronis]